MRKIAILGSTGSIGTQTLDIIRENKDFEVTALAAGRSIDLLEKQIREFTPRLAVVYDREAAELLRGRVADLPVKVLTGMEGLLEMAVMPDCDILVTAIVGMIGIRPTLAAIEAGKDIALANKETLVTAGHLIMPLAGKKGVSILPVDSEHSAIFQCLHGEDRGQISHLLITASGGPFRHMKTEQLQNIRPADALKHPNWSMGAKITIDSSTLVNKGLEVMEARWLFDTPLDRIQVVVHPQSIIHSMVEFTDGAVLAQLGTPDMHLPIQYALYYPQRRPLPGKRLDFTQISSIVFEEPASAAPCRRYSMRPTRQLWQSSCGRRSDFWISTGSSRNPWPGTASLRSRILTRSWRQKRRPETGSRQISEPAFLDRGSRRH